MPKHVDPTAIYEPAEVAQLLRVEERTARDYMNRGQLRGQRLGKKGWRTTGQAILDFLEVQETISSVGELGATMESSLAAVKLG
jgi:hypothetical protein